MRLVGVLLRLSAAAAFARAGGGHSFSSGGSYHASGGSLGYSGGGGSSGGADAVGPLLELWIRFVVVHPLLGIPITLAILYVCLQAYGAFDDARVSGTISRGLEAQDTLSLRRNLEALRGHDPDFAPEPFMKRVEQAFLSVQAAWSAMDMAPARAWVSDGVMERFAVQLAMLRAEGVRNDMKDVQVLECEILQIESSAFWDVIHARVEASAIDRDVSLEDGSVVRGGDEAETFEEVWTFARRPSARTVAGRGGFSGACPNCGTPLPAVDGEQCPACKSWLNSGEFDWVLCEITQASEWGSRQPREVPGLAELAARDAALNARFLEDRASVAFWRWQEALWSGDTKALLSVASDDFCARSADGGGSYFREAAVGAVISLALESGGEQERAHLVVRWSGERCRRGERLEGAKDFSETVLILARRAGALTDARAGLRSLRCAACGAPPTSRDAASCEYCGHKFNDGSRQWVLVDLVPASSWKRPEPRVAAGVGAAAAQLPAAASASAPADYGWTAGLSADAALRLMAAAMAADGEIAPEETRYLETFARRRGVPEQTTAQLIAAARAGRIDAPAPQSRAQACAFLRGLIIMSLADGKITRQERQAIDACAQGLQLGQGDVDDLIAREREALYKSAKETLKAAS